MAAITVSRSDLTAKELRAAAGREKDSAASRQMLALAMVLDGADRTSAAENCGMDRQTLRDWVHVTTRRARRVCAIVHQPPYAPELNPVENVWQYLRGNKLSNTIYKNYDDILETACRAWMFFATDKERVASITTRQWAEVSL